jgi:hypothetical protein
LIAKLTAKPALYDAQKRIIANKLAHLFLLDWPEKLVERFARSNEKASREPI